MANSASGSLQRPVSPHLQIWRFTVTMAASITHRGTGMVLYGGSLLLLVWLYALAFSPSLYASVAGFVTTPIGFIIVAGYVWALSFHLMNGLRHLYWDYGRGLAIKTATMTAWLIYGASILLAAIILLIGYNAIGAA
ncbi:succinate dehydrogenase, cytochrome b556 subunit [Hyphococcus flavus]|uniref:Succinate dehydrogenase cytochrome b556 subunit n=1 Tax=Hyphococcus flavus TaxID=1866326 RepID=A0AAE9ZFR3_9PROT|nr:succinate dehydrogenase, cytochrome b556 subunit [Hyphococcus flavus]WDI33020.1 succinate dehydrogenase, cytochrome b556 subunit [Hyphococcus flavus]